MSSQVINSRFSQLSNGKKWLLLSLPLVAIVGISASLPKSTLTRTVELNLKDYYAQTNSNLSTSLEEWQNPPSFEYQIQSGDNLSTIFTQLGFGYQQMMKVMETDLDFLVLDTLRPGNTLRFWKDEETGTLDKMELALGIADKAVFTRNDDGSFAFEQVSLPGEWRQQPLIGTIEGSFSSSAYRLGLNSIEIDQVVSLLREKINFSKDLRAGDSFEIVRRNQFIDGVESGKRQIEAIKIFNRGREITAYLHTDGQFYDAKGQSLQRAFQRYPVTTNWRLSSNFNPHRLHPVTGRVMPHNGTDFATPIGTPVMSTGDGTVILVRKNHPFAGNYVVVEHGSKYKTRYLHLSKVLVTKGQKVSRGQRIGLSGKTGRVTGPHLHYELLENNRPVDAMKANIPMASSVPKKEMAGFLATVNELNTLLREQEQQNI
ncbi:peptidoglycan DD-metalloendopeptidase family protein [Vibrio sp. IRLE0018]|uniref:peptidoglycan DD-metalloendopeptidase family protein n=1 Tax=Vibrio TaxID=662 RepID=UPI001592D12E|nr:peptidoglycan DD-metalloendopeptidase family protein [Vibrio floridensis]NVC61598.1 peptidase M23 [Vibrio sp. 05-20-BW147]HAS6346768.1 peptidoglycan DD-metalloendopeptidase family protein [Vibrio vulnificus]